MNIAIVVVFLVVVFFVTAGKFATVYERVYKSGEDDGKHIIQHILAYLVFVIVILGLFYGKGHGWYQPHLHILYSAIILVLYVIYCIEKYKKLK